MCNPRSFCLVSSTNRIVIPADLLVAAFHLMLGYCMPRSYNIFVTQKLAT